jgi:hypothetical protein
VTLSLALVGAALAGEPARWPDAEFPLSYWVGADLHAAGVDDGKAVAAIARAFQTWQAVECFDAQFVLAGRVEDTLYGDPADGLDVVYMVGAHWPGDPLMPSASRTVVGEDGFIREADVALNAEGFRYSADGDGHAALDIESAVAHEIGRILGLEESVVPGATMNPAMVGQPDGRSLEESDVAAACALYVSIGDTAGSSRTEQGDACTRSDDCTDGFVCVVDNGEQYCAERCGTGVECASGTSCLDPGSGSPVCIVDRATGCDTGGVGGASWLAATALALVARIRKRP